MRQWYVEDAGGGCKAFSEILVLVSEEPREIYKTCVPLTWSDQQSLEEVVCHLLIDMMECAGVTKKDHIYVCSGNIFYDYHKWLKENNYTWESAKIDGLAHEVAEDEFYSQMVAAGFPEHIHLKDRNYREFYRIVEKWLEQVPQGHLFLKDFSVRQKPAEARYTLKSNYARARKCNGCHRNIQPFVPMVEFKIRENGKRKRKYFHPECSPVTPIKNRLTTLDIIWKNKGLTGVILPCKMDSVCTICNNPVKAGSPAFYGYNSDTLIFGHKECFQSRGL